MNCWSTISKYYKKKQNVNLNYLHFPQIFNNSMRLRRKQLLLLLTMLLFLAVSWDVLLLLFLSTVTCSPSATGWSLFRVSCSWVSWFHVSWSSSVSWSSVAMRSWNESDLVTLLSAILYSINKVRKKQLYTDIDHFLSLPNILTSVICRCRCQGGFAWAAYLHV